MSSSTNVALSKGWPETIVQKYDPVRILGEGGFASVILAKLKPNTHININMEDTRNITTSNENNSNNHNNNNILKAGTLVAIKAAWGEMSNVHDAKAYWHREVDILQAISHPNIMKCYDYCFDDDDHTKNNNHSHPNQPGGTPHKMAMVLSYSKGPTVESLLKHGGALSNDFGRVVMAQVIDAIAYLHSHAVVHRDLKPDNFIVTGAASSQAEIWDNPQGEQEKKDNDASNPASANSHGASSGTLPASKPPEYWSALMQKWHVTVVDFGFARALTPNDVVQPSPELHRENMRSSFHVDHEYGKTSAAAAAAAAAGRRTSNAAYLNTSMGASTSRGSRTGKMVRRLSSSLSGGGGSSRGAAGEGPMRRTKSISQQLHRRMSALGNYEFAAPEIRNKVIKDDHHESDAINNENKQGDVTQTISSFVAEYGLLVDAYSLGCSIRYMMTGVLPHQSVSQAIADQSSMVEQLCGLLCRKQTNSSNAPRKPRYRFVNELPGEVQRLISKMMELEESKRTSVRSARRYHWINDVLPVDEEHKENTQRLVDTKAIQYLSFKPYQA